MNTENGVLECIKHGDFHQAVSDWRDLAAQKGYFGRNTTAPWGLSARLLEARLIYLSMFKQDAEFQEFVDQYRAWLLVQATQVTTPMVLSMERIELPDSMRVGHPVIDGDHENLFAHANDIRNALRDGDHRQAASLADRLIDEILAHFAREEQVLMDVGYPESEEHIQYHTILKAKAEEVRKVLLRMLNDSPAAVVTFDMLISFLVNDPIAADLDFKAFFQGQTQDQAKTRSTAGQTPQSQTPQPTVGVE